MRDAPWAGEVLEATGTYNDSSFGQQLEAALIFRKLPERDQIVSFVEHHPYFIGVGRLAISRIWREQGIRLYELLCTCDVRGLVQTGLTMRQAGVIVRGWKQYQDELEVQRFATDHELSVSSVAKAKAIWGNGAFERITSDPFSLVYFERWAAVDSFAKAVFGVGPNSLVRRRGACLKVLNDAAAMGHIHLKESEATRRIARLLASDELARKAIRECIERGDVRKQGKAAASRLQGQGAWILERSLAQLFAHRKVIFHGNGNGVALCATDQRPTLEVCVFDEMRRIGNVSSWPSERPALHVFSSNSVSSRLRNHVIGASFVSVQDLLARGMDAAYDVDMVVVHDAAILSFVAIHALLRRLVGAVRIILSCYAPCMFERFFLKHLTAGATLKLGEAEGLFTGPRQPSWSRVSHETSTPETLSLSMTAGGRLARLMICVRDFREGYDVAGGQFRMCVSIGNALLVTMTRAHAMLVNRQFHVENLDARKYQNLPTPVVALARQQFVTIGDHVIWDGNNFARRLLRGMRGEVRHVWKRGFVEVDETGVHELALTVSFDGVGDVNIRREETSLLRLGYATSFLEPISTRVEFVVVMLSRSRFSVSDAIALAVARSAAATVVVGTGDELRRAGIIGRRRSSKGESK
ncbi:MULTISPECIES: hypothetical protein [unclassified Caballeronia]|uniref:hypothetical protein n=1 Tax=unclassified Caballeronia TaxID=2646786 RepID=UPI002027DEA7|nr:MULTISPECIES: hypothetical protein [unclassified Caballeronia]MDR5765906.1 hypothetical protein [Caballeronia sp. LZ028]